MRFSIPVMLAALLWVNLMEVPTSAQEAEASEENAGPPVHEAARGIDVAVNGEVGAILRLGNGWQLEIPAGLRMSRSHMLTFETPRRGPRPAQIHRSFRATGPAVRFSETLAANRSPLVFSLRQRRFTARAGHRLVLMSEQAGFCQDHNRRQTLGGGLCSTWQVYPARYDEGEQRLVADVTSSGGHRLIFGWLPESVLEGMELPGELTP